MKPIKKHISSIATPFLALWFLCCVVGFDIHTDHLHGKTYIVPMFAGLSCEAIHPDELCHCCHHCPGEDDDDCTDEMEQISILDCCSVLSMDFTPIFSWDSSLGSADESGVQDSDVSYEVVSFSSRRLLSDICVLRV